MQKDQKRYYIATLTAQRLFALHEFTTSRVVTPYFEYTFIVDSKGAKLKYENKSTAIKKNSGLYRITVKGSDTPKITNEGDALYKVYLAKAKKGKKTGFEQQTPDKSKTDFLFVSLGHGVFNYFFPVEVIAEQNQINLRPGSAEDKYKEYLL